VEAALTVKQVCKSYGGRRVVDNVSFEVYPGEIMALLGPNGAGKTTIIRMIMGIVGLDAGELQFRFEPGTVAKTVDKAKVGYLPEERGLYRESQVLDVLIFLAGLKGVPKEVAKQRALEWLERFGLGNYARAKVQELSKGMAQRVQFIATVLHEPSLVVLDEPFSGLDPVSQDFFQEEIRKLAQRGTAVLLCSHQMNLVEAICHRIFLINEGQRVLYGSLRDIKTQYGNYRVNMLMEAADDGLLHHPLVAEHQWRGNRLILLLKDGVGPAEFVNSLDPSLTIEELSITRISLHDIFVRVAKKEAVV